VVLVGHSYGGMVITDAASGQENVKHLVYVTSVMPERGETLASFGGSGLGPWMDPREEDGTMSIKAELAPAAFMQDCDEETVTEALKRLTRQPLAAFAQSLALSRGGRSPRPTSCAPRTGRRLRTHSAATRGRRIAWWSC
jgi:pimeloyl-ACP methyl ester carboxylesterase